MSYYKKKMQELNGRIGGQAKEITALLKQIEKQKAEIRDLASKCATMEGTAKANLDYAEDYRKQNLELREKVKKCRYVADSLLENFVGGGRYE